MGRAARKRKQKIRCNQVQIQAKQSIDNIPQQSSLLSNTPSHPTFFRTTLSPRHQFIPHFLPQPSLLIISFLTFSRNPLCSPFYFSLSPAILSAHHFILQILPQLTDLVWYWAELPGLLIRLQIPRSNRRTENHTNINIFAHPNMINPA